MFQNNNIYENNLKTQAQNGNRIQTLHNLNYYLRVYILKGNQIVGKLEH